MTVFIEMFVAWSKTKALCGTVPSFRDICMGHTGRKWAHRMGHSIAMENECVPQKTNIEIAFIFF